MEPQNLKQKPQRKFKQGLNKNEIDKIISAIGTTFNLTPVDKNKYNPMYTQVQDPNIYREKDPLKIRAEIEQYRKLQNGTLFPEITNAIKANPYYGESMGDLINKYIEGDDQLLTQLNTLRDITQPLEGVTTGMANANGLALTYAERKTNLNKLLDMMYQQIAHKLNMPVERVPKLVQALAAQTGITTSDLRLLLLIDDWTDTFKKIISKGSEAFQDIIPYGKQINQLIQGVLTPSSVTKSSATLGSLYKDYLTGISPIVDSGPAQVQPFNRNINLTTTSNGSGYYYLMVAPIGNTNIVVNYPNYIPGTPGSATSLVSVSAIANYCYCSQILLKLSLRELDNVAFQIETAFSTSPNPADDLSILEDYDITTDRNAYINLHISPRFTNAMSYIHIRIFTSASTVMGNLSLQMTGQLSLIDTLKSWLGKNSNQIPSDLVDVVEQNQDNMRRLHRYDTPAILSQYANRFVDAIDIPSITKLF